MKISTPHLKADLTCSTQEEYVEALLELKTLMDFLDEGFAAVIFKIPKLQLAASDGQTVKSDVRFRDFEISYDSGSRQLLLTKSQKDE